jgi:hypothetical protein
MKPLKALAVSTRAKEEILWPLRQPRPPKGISVWGTGGGNAHFVMIVITL